MPTRGAVRSAPAEEVRGSGDRRLEQIVAKQGDWAVRANGRALRHLSETGTEDNRRMEWYIVLNLADLRLPVLGGDVAL